MPELTLRGPAGLLRARHDPPQSAAPDSTSVARGAPAAAGAARAAQASASGVAGRLRAAVVCHPHPLHGGTMDNKVVFTVAKALRERGLHVLRFNFRGAGGSEGSHDDGRGEVGDARAALDFAARLPDAAQGGAQSGAQASAAAAGLARADAPSNTAPGTLLMAGFSFGSFVGLTAALEDPRVGALLAIAPPVDRYDYARIAATDKPLAVIYARDDELVPAAQVEAFLARCTRPPRVRRIDGCGHLFHARLAEVRRAVDELLPALG